MGTARLLAMLLGLPLILFAGTASPLEVLQGAPLGFEPLANPRASVVTLSYGGETLGDFPAHLLPGSVRFDDANAILRLIPALQDRQGLALMLGAPLPANAGLLCAARAKPGCGVLQPASLGIIFDETRLSAELFIAPRYLAISGADAPRYLPLPRTREISSVYGFQGAVSGGGEASPAYALSGNGVFSYGETQLTTQTTLADTGLRFDTMTLSRERLGWNSTAGLFRSNASMLLGDRDIAGVSLATSERTRSEGYKTEGNALIVYLPRRAIVSVLRGGRLLSSRSYPAGNQAIDTRELPGGAYNVTLRIQEEGGAVREEQRFFAKMDEIPPPGSPRYYAQAGFIRSVPAHDSTLPHITGAPVLLAGSARRLGENSGVALGLMGLADRIVAEPGVFITGENFQARLALLGSSADDKGAVFTWQQTMGAVQGNLDARFLTSTRTPLPGYGDIGHRFRQVSASLATLPASNVTLGLRASVSAQSATPATGTFGPYAEWRLWQQGDDMLFVEADLARAQQATQASLMLHFSHRLGENGVTGSASLANAAAGGASSDVHLWHEHTSPGQHLLTSLNASASRDRQSLGADAQLQGETGQWHGSLAQGFGKTAGLAYGGNVAINAAQAGNQVVIGGEDTEKSGVRVQIHGDSDTPMRVTINGAEKALLRPGESRVFYLSPFAEYRVRVAPKNSALLDYDANEKHVTLYPGNIATLSWTVQRFTVVVAHIVTPSGAPLTHALLSEARLPTSTDEHGALQAELSAPDVLHFIKEGHRTCGVRLPKPERTVNGVWLYRSPLPCMS